jgi:hypothetical protein
MFDDLGRDIAAIRLYATDTADHDLADDVQEAALRRVRRWRGSQLPGHRT